MMIYVLMIFGAIVLGAAFGMMHRSGKLWQDSYYSNDPWRVEHGIGKDDTGLPAVPFTVDAATEPHYVLLTTGPLTGKTQITMTGKVEGAAGMVPVTGATAMTDMCLFFQRSGDDMSGNGPMEFYRWWAGSTMMKPIVDGPFTLTASLLGEWGSVFGHSNRDNAAAFADALAHCESVGFVLGGGTGLGHGITGTGKINVTSFVIS